MECCVASVRFGAQIKHLAWNDVQRRQWLQAEFTSGILSNSPWPKIYTFFSEDVHLGSNHTTFTFFDAHNLIWLAVGWELLSTRSIDISLALLVSRMANSTQVETGSFRLLHLWLLYIGIIIPFWNDKQQIFIISVGLDKRRCFICKKAQHQWYHLHPITQPFLETWQWLSILLFKLYV